MNFSGESMYKCCPLVPGFGGPICDCVGHEACDAYHIYHGCTRLTEMFEGFNTGPTNSPLIHVYANKHGPAEMFHCCALRDMYKAMDKTDHSMVDEEDNHAAV